MNEFLKSIDQAMAALNESETEKQVALALESGTAPLEIFNTMSAVMKRIGDRFSLGEAFIPELVMSGRIFKSMMKILTPKLGAGKNQSSKGTVLLGTVKGDLHDLGVGLVELVMSAEGFEVVNLGKDVSTQTFVERVVELKPHILGMSALLTTTLNEQKVVIDKLKFLGLRDGVQIMVGGAPVTQDWADSIGADAVGFDAVDAVEKALALMRRI